MTLSQYDRDILIRTIIGEAANEGPEGWAGVAHTIKNRSTDPRWPSGVADVSLQPKQFSAWNKGAGGNHLVNKYGPDSGIYQNVGEIADQVFAGEYADPTGGATHYYSPAGMRALVNSGSQSNVLPRWLQKETDRRGGETTTIGGHIFTGLASGATPATPNPHPPITPKPPLGQSAPAQDNTPMLMAMFGNTGQQSAIGNAGADALGGGVSAPPPAPMRSTAPSPVQGQTAALAPTVAEGSGMAKSVSTTLAPTPQQIAQRQAMARALAQEADNVQVIQHPLQGVDKMAKSALAGYQQMKVRQGETQRAEALASVISGMGGTTGAYSQQQIAQAAAVDPKIAMGMVQQNRAAEAAAAERAQAANTPKTMQIFDEETGRPMMARVFPDGRIEKLGGVKSDTMSPEAEEQKARIAAAGRTSVTTNLNPGQAPSDAELRKKLDGQEAELWGGYQQAGAQSAALQQDFQVLDELIQFAPQGPLEGRLAEMFPGFNSAGDAFQSIVKRLAPTMRVEGSGSTSDIEYEGMLKSLPALANKPEANVMIAEIMKAKAAINIERAQIVDAYRNNDLSAADARRALSDLNKRSIMTPDMKRALVGVGSLESEKVNSESSAIQKGRDAIAAGADRALVIQRLQEAGIDPTGL